MKKIIIITGLFFAVFGQSCAQKSQKGFAVTVESLNYKAGDTLFLAQYIGEKVDTLMLNIMKNSGFTIFADKTPLNPGIYKIIQTPDKTFDFFISENQPQHFSITFNRNDLPKSIVFKGSPENSVAYSFYRFVNQPNISERAVMDSVSYLIKYYPQYCFADYLSLKQKLKDTVPVIPMLIQNRDSAVREFYFKYVREHFFDAVNFNSKALTGIPDFELKMQDYFTQILSQDKDITIKYLDIFLDKLAENKPVYQFAVKYLSKLYLQAPYESLKEVYPYILQKYIIEKPQMWNNSVFIAETEQKLKMLTINPIGGKAADLALQTPEEQTVKISDSQAAYTVLYFYDPDCSTCQEVTPVVYELFRQYENKDLNFYAIYTEYNKSIWTDYIAEKNMTWINVWDSKNSQQLTLKYDLSLLPSIYVLDAQKQVILRDCTPEALEAFLKGL